MSDCVPVMKEMIEKGELFDYIIYDITDVPVTPTPEGNRNPKCINHVINPTDSVWKTIHDMLDMAMRLLSPTGFCMVQVSRDLLQCGVWLTDWC